MLDLAGWQVNLIKRIVQREREREREREVDSRCPSPQRPAPNFDVTGWETQNKPLSAELLTRFLTRTRSDAHPTSALRHLLRHPLSPELGAGTLLVSPLQQEEPAGLSLLRTEPCPISCEWCLPLCEAADGSAHRRKERFLCAPPPKRKKKLPHPKEAADVTEEERRREKHNLPNPSFPHLGEQYPDSSWRGVSFCPSPHAPATRAKSRQTRWHIDPLLWDEKPAQQHLLRFFMCVFWFSTWTAPEQQPDWERVCVCQWVYRLYWFGFGDQEAKMQTPCSLQLGPSPSLGSQGSIGGIHQLEEKQLFEKFWKGTFKAVATPRPESVIVASITASRKVTKWVLNFVVTVFCPPPCEMCLLLSSIDCFSMIWWRNHWTCLVHPETGRILVFWICQDTSTKDIQSYCWIFISMFSFLLRNEHVDHVSQSLSSPQDHAFFDLQFKWKSSCLVETAVCFHYVVNRFDVSTPSKTTIVRTTFLRTIV